MHKAHCVETPLVANHDRPLSCSLIFLPSKSPYLPRSLATLLTSGRHLDPAIDLANI